MRATKNVVRTGLFLLGVVLSLAVPAESQTLLANGSASPPPIILQSSTPYIVSLSSSDGSTAIPFSVTLGGTSFFSATTPDGTNTPARVILVATNLSCFLSNTCNGTVTLQDTRTGQAGDKIVISVGYSNAAGGGGTITTSAPATGLSLSSVAGLGSAQFLISTSSTNPISFTLTPSYTTGSGWLSAAVTSGSTAVVSGSPATVTVTANATGLATGVYYGSIVINPTGQSSITIPVTFSVGTGTLTAAPSSIAWSYVTAGALPSQVVGLSSSAGATTFGATASSSGWLLVNGNTSAFGLPLTGGLTVSLAGTATSLLTGTYAGYVVVTASDGSTVQINVNLTVNGGSVPGITLSQNTVSFAAAGASSTPPPATITVTGGTTISSSVNNGNAWLQVSQNSLASPALLTVTANPSGLPAGTYLGSITINTNPGGATASQVVAVTLTVGSSTTGGATSLVAPSSLSFAAQVSGSSVPAQYLIAGGGVNVISATASVTTPSGGVWLSAYSSQGSSVVTVYVIPGNLGPGVYSGAVTVTSPAGTQQIPVTLTVTTAPDILATCQCYFNYVTGTGNPSTTAYLSASDGSSFSVSSAASSVTWLTATVVAGSNALQIVANPAGLSAGVYSGTITANIAGNTTQAYANTPFSIPVGLVVNGGGVSGPLTFSSTSVTFQVQPGSGAVGGFLGVNSAVATSFIVSSTPASGTSWLTVGSSQGTTPATVSIQVNPAGLPLGVTTGSLTFSTASATQTVPVVVVVGGATLTATPTSLSFTAPAGGAVTASQAVMVTSTGSALSFTVGTSAAWLKVDKTSAATPATINVTADPSVLSPQTYTGTITLTPTTGNTLTTVNVTFTVTPSVIPSSSSLTFTSSGGSVPPAQTVTISGGAFNATASSSAGWLSVSPTSGSAGSAISVSVNPAGLAVGNYTGTISITGAGGSIGTSTINVTLTVSAPLPTIVKVVNAASYVGGAIAPGEALYIQGTNIGPATLASAQIASNGKLATTLSGVQVLVNGFPAPLYYAQATQVAALVPYEVASFGTVSVEVQYLGQTSNVIGLPVTTAAPGIFTQNQQGTGPAAYNTNGTLNGPNNPVGKGGYVVLFLTGEGQTSPLGVTGTINSSTSTANIPKPLLPVTVTLGGQTLPSSAIAYVGGVPGAVEGFTQLNIQIPTTAASGDLPLVVTIGGNSSQSGVTVSVR